MAVSVKQYAKNALMALHNLAYGSVLPITNAGAPTDGTSGTGADVCGKGTLCIDTTNGVLYINTGTKTSPTWIVVGTQT